MVLHTTPVLTLPEAAIRPWLVLSWEGRVPSTVIAALAVTFVLVAGGVSSARADAGARTPKHLTGRGSSANWSGYAIDGTGATQAIGTWTEPAVTCAPGENSWASPWVGIDGDTSNPVEQTGSDSDCVRGRAVYYAWYELYPKSLVKLSMAVHPGDSLTGIVTYAGGTSFALKLTDNTTKASFTTTQSDKQATRTSVEWIMEGPASGILSDFGSVAFSAASATIGGQSAGLGSFAAAHPITMVSSAGTVRAQPSPLSSNAFSVTWVQQVSRIRPGRRAPGHA